MFKFICGTTFGFLTCATIVGCAYAAFVGGGLLATENDDLRKVVHRMLHEGENTNEDTETLYKSSDYKA